MERIPINGRHCYLHRADSPVLLVALHGYAQGVTAADVPEPTKTRKRLQPWSAPFAEWSGLLTLGVNVVFPQAEISGPLKVTNWRKRDGDFFYDCWAESKKWVGIERRILFGFSDGGTLATYVFPSIAGELAGVILHSADVRTVYSYEDELTTKVALITGDGRAAPGTRIEGKARKAADKAVGKFRGMGHTVWRKVVPKWGHAVSVGAVREALAWVQQERSGE